jgi:hypothetical protein
MRAGPILPQISADDSKTVVNGQVKNSGWSGEQMSGMLNSAQVCTPTETKTPTMAERTCATNIVRGGTLR